MRETAVSGTYSLSVLTLDQANQRRGSPTWEATLGFRTVYGRDSDRAITPLSFRHIPSRIKHKWDGSNVEAATVVVAPAVVVLTVGAGVVDVGEKEPGVFSALSVFSGFSFFFLRAALASSSRLCSL